MAITTEMTNNHITATNAQTAAAQAKAAQARGNAVTDRGTRIVTSNNEMDTSSFLKILAAEMKNLDPTSSGQDSTAQVTQMAQFSSMQVMQNLNATMTDSAYDQMVGKTVILNQKDANGQYIKGIVNGVIKQSGSTFFDMEINGEEQEVKASNVIGVNGSDTNTISNYRSALNSDFLAASSLASNKQSVVIPDVDENKKPILVKGKVSGAYIDTVDRAVVKVKVDLVDDAGNSTGKSKIYDYSSIVRAGDLTNEDMNVKLTDTTGTIATTTDGTSKYVPSTSGTKKSTDIYYPYPGEVKKNTSATTSRTTGNSSTDTNTSNNSTTDTSGTSSSTVGA
jgi:flagellar basal-body rod modification protein FlgD